MANIISDAWSLVTTIGADEYIVAGFLFALAIYVVRRLTKR